MEVFFPGIFRERRLIYTPEISKFDNFNADFTVAGPLVFS